MAVALASLSFDAPDLPQRLDAAPAEEFDELSFGLIEMSSTGRVVAYNETESRLSGLSPERVLGQSFFEQVAPCMNNALVAARFSEDALDEIVDYVFTFRMAPTKVTLRLMRRRGSDRCFLAVRKA